MTALSTAPVEETQRWTAGDPQPHDLDHVWDAEGEKWSYDSLDGRWTWGSPTVRGGYMRRGWHELTHLYGPVYRNRPVSDGEHAANVAAMAAETRQAVS